MTGDAEELGREEGGKGEGGGGAGEGREGQGREDSKSYIHHRTRMRTSTSLQAGGEEGRRWEEKGGEGGEEEWMGEGLTLVPEFRCLPNEANQLAPRRQMA